MWRRSLTSRHAAWMTQAALDEERHRPHLDEDRCPVDGDHRLLGRGDLARPLLERRDAVGQRLVAVGVEELEGVPADDLLRAARAQERHAGVVDERRDAAFVEEDAVGRPLHDLPVAPLGLA